MKGTGRRPSERTSSSRSSSVTGTRASPGPVIARVITTPMMKITDSSEMKEVLDSADMFFSIASGSTAPMASAVSVMRLIHILVSK